MSHRAWFGLGLLLVGGIRTRMLAQSASERSLEPLPIDSLLRARTFGEYSEPMFSPRGDWIAYTVREQTPNSSMSATRDLVERAGIPWYALGARIVLVDTSGRTVRQLPVGDGESWLPTWSPRGRSVAFFSSRKPPGGGPLAARLWVWDLDANRVRLVSPRRVRPGPLAWSSDGRRLLVHLAPSVEPAGQATERTPAPAPTPDSPAPVSGSTVVLYRGDAAAGKAPGWSLAWNRGDLTWVDVATGRESVVAADLHVSKALVAPRGDRVAFTTPKRFERDGSQQILFDLLVSDSAPSAAPRLLARDIRLDYDGAQFSWSPDGTHLAYRTAGVLASGDVFVIGLDAAEPRLVSPTPHPPFTVLHQRMAPSWDARGRHVLFADTGAVWAASLADGQLTAVARLAGQSVRLLTTSGGGVLSPDRGLTTLVIATDMRTGKTAFCRVRFPPTPEGAAESSCVARDGSVGGYGPNDGAAVSDDGTLLVFASQDASHAPDLYLARHGDVTAATRLTAIAPAFDRVVMGEQRIISWRTGDGDTVRGVLLLPAGYQTGKRYPLITRVYGGIQPSRLYVDRFGVERPAIDNLQVLATRGYAILLPDIVFKGEGEVLSQLPKIVLPGVERVVELGIADSSRLGLMGHSFGGFNTIAMLTQTSRFRAAVMSAGTADVVATYGQLLPDGTSYGIAVVEHGQFLMNGTPWEQPRRYLDNSPVWHLDRVTTPLLIVHGGADHAVAPFLAEQVFVGLRRLGKPVVYAKYAGEEHHQATWSYANQLDYWNRVIAWFDTYLKGERR